MRTANFTSAPHMNFTTFKPSIQMHFVTKATNLCGSILCQTFDTLAYSNNGQQTET